MIKTKTAIGKWGEEQAALFLMRIGYRVLERNFFTRHGEIDIVAFFYEKNNSKVISFVEVKTRKQSDGSAERATNRTKINRLKYSAAVYCRKNNIDVQTVSILFEHISVCVIGANTVNISKFILPLNA
ncbi:MAG: YraN family protein [Patescibacteria group bacterium]